jgi:hypothetical protein
MTKKTEMHIDSLHDADINEMVDRHLFGGDPWCYGSAQRDVLGGVVSVARCQRCGQVDIEVGRHPRLVPRYSVEQIIAAMLNHKNELYRDLFALACTSVPSPTKRIRLRAAKHIISTFSTPRQVGIIALKVLGVVSSRGYIGSQGERVDGRRLARV